MHSVVAILKAAEPKVGFCDERLLPERMIDAYLAWLPITAAHSLRYCNSKYLHRSYIVPRAQRLLTSYGLHALGDHRPWSTTCSIFASLRREWRYTLCCLQLHACGTSCQLLQTNAASLKGVFKTGLLCFSWLVITSNKIRILPLIVAVPRPLDRSMVIDASS